MKQLVFTLFMALSMGLFSQNPCSYTQIGGGGSGIAAVDTAVIFEGFPRCLPCPADGQVCWQLPSDSSMYIYLHSQDSTDVAVQLTTGCDYLLWDTCVTLRKRSPVTTPFRIGVVLPQLSQICVSGPIGDSVMIDVKVVPNMHFKRYDTPIIDLRDCGIATAIQEPLPIGRYEYIDPYTLKVVRALQPHRFYLKRHRRE